MIQALADVTERCWAKRKQNTQGRSADVRVVSPTQRSQNIWQAGRRMIPRGNTHSRSEMHDEDEDARVICERNVAGPNVQEDYRICEVVQAVSGMTSVSEEQRPRLNAALLSMVQGVADTTNSAGVADSGIVEATETVSQVGLSQASTESYYPEEETIAERIQNWPARRWGRSVMCE